MRLFLVALAFVGAATSACDESFTSPPIPDLYKPPHDLSAVSSDDLGVFDMRGTSNGDLRRGDLSAQKLDDMASPDDLLGDDAN